MRIDAFAVSLTGYLLSLAVHTPPARPVTPEQTIAAYERQLETDLFSNPKLSPPPPAPMPQFIKPAQGILTSGYGMRWGRMHRGIDIAGPTGTPILAAADGQVISAGWNSGGYGNLVAIRHSDGTITRYAHNSQILVAAGQSVTQGQAIALMGSTGYSTGPHCHFEILPNGKEAVNPLAFLPKI